jgi:hypothetical protein
LDGIDLLPVLQGKRKAGARTLFWRYKRGDLRHKAVRDGDWKYTNHSGEEGLYNIARDEQEKDNVLSKKPDIAATLKTKLADWEKEVRAPRLRDFQSA